MSLFENLKKNMNFLSKKCIFIETLNLKNIIEEFIEPDPLHRVHLETIVSNTYVPPYLTSEHGKGLVIFIGRTFTLSY